MSTSSYSGLSARFLSNVVQSQKCAPRSLYAISSSTGRPAGATSEAVESEAATMRAPASFSSSAAFAPALPKPWMATRLPRRSSCAALRAASSTSKPPRAVALSRPSEPPCSTVLPVTTAGSARPDWRPNSSASQSMIRASVLTSGAGMSTSGPITRQMRSVYARVSASSSCGDSRWGSTVMPPLPPPIGMLTTAVLMLIHPASALTSSRLTLGWYRMPPL